MIKVNKVRGMTEIPVNPSSQTVAAKLLNQPKYTIGSDNSDLMQRIGYVALRVFFVLGAIGLMVTGSGIAIALGVLLFLAVVCTLPRAKDH